MSAFRLSSLVSLLLLSCLGPTGRGDELAKRLNEVINGSDYKQSHWGLLVVDLKTGKTVFEHEADRLCAPASVTKLFTCASALSYLGQHYRFETPVYRRGMLHRGVLQGDLILVASGDLDFGGRTNRRGQLEFDNDDHTYANGSPKAGLTSTDPLAAVKSLAAQVKRSGIHKVTGDVLIDDRLFEPARGSGSGPDRLTPILVNDNVVDVIITPAVKIGAQATVKLRPETGFVQVDARVETVAGDQKARVTVRPLGNGRYTLRGVIPRDHEPLVRILAVSDPAAFARALFIETLRAEGVDVPASPLREPGATLPDGDDYPRLPRVAVWTSAPLSEGIKVTLKVSHNLYASTLPLLVAARHDQRTLADGLRLQGQRLSAFGLDTSTISFAGGAGGERADRVTPRATVLLLRAMVRRPEFAAYKNGLPVMGVDGTLATVVEKNSPARGRVWAKTGTLSYPDLINDRTLLRSKALGGYMLTAKGTELAFAFFVNEVPLPPKTTTQREGKVLGKLCEIVIQHAP